MNKEEATTLRALIARVASSRANWILVGSNVDSTPADLRNALERVERAQTDVDAYIDALTKEA